MRFSTRVATSSVAAKLAPSGSQSDTRISVRVESGKNCCCTRPMPAMPSANTSAVALMVSQRRRTHQATRRRKAM